MTDTDRLEACRQNLARVQAELSACQQQRNSARIAAQKAIDKAYREGEDLTYQRRAMSAERERDELRGIIERIGIVTECHTIWPTDIEARVCTIMAELVRLEQTNKPDTRG